MRTALARALVELGDGADGMPVAAHELAHWRAGANLRQPFVLLLAEHADPIAGGGEPMSGASELTPARWRAATRPGSVLRLREP